MNISDFNNKEFRLKTFHKIKNKQKNTIPFILNNIQKQILYKIRELKEKNKPLRLCILKPRQVGITTFFCNYFLDTVCWRSNQFYAIVAHRRDVNKTIFEEYIRFTYDRFPQNILNKPHSDSANQLFWKEHGSQVIVRSDLHGQACNILHLTEVSRIKKTAENLGEWYQSVPLENGIIIQESTANGLNYFYDHWQEINSNKDSIWTPMFLEWWQHKEYQIHDILKNITEEEKELKAKYNIKDSQLLFRRQRIEESGGSRIDIETGISGKTLFKQNYPMHDREAFISSGGCIFNQINLNIMLQKKDILIKEQQYESGMLKIYKTKKNTKYLISADTSEGTGNDFSVAIIFDVTNFEIVGKLRGKYRPKTLAKYLNRLGKFYNYAIIAPERNNHGHAVIDDLETLGCTNIYRHTKDQEYGFPTTSITKQLYITTLEELIETKEIDITDKETIRECMSFGYHKGKMQAMRGHDDCVIALAIGSYIITRIKQRYQEIPIRKKPIGL